MAIEPQIIAMGGGGFSMEPENLALDRYVLAATGKPRPRVCFIPTASGDAQSYLDLFHASFATLDCVPTHLSLFKPPAEPLRDFVFAQDAIYVGGGNTRNLLALWREWGLDEVLRDAWHAGIVLAGLSAGSLCWFEQGISDSFHPTELRPIECLGLLPGSHCPHYDGEANRRPSYQHFIRQGTIAPGYAADDGVGLHYIGTELTHIVSSRPNARAYAVAVEDGEIHETALQPHLL
jgi:peptidase E